MHPIELAEVYSRCGLAVKDILDIFSCNSDCGFSGCNPDFFVSKELRAYQLEFLKTRERVVILNWSRQIGKSTALAFWALLRATFRPNHTVCVFSNTVKNAEEILFKIEDFIKKDESCFLNYRLRRSRIEFANGSRIVVLAAAARTARGYSGDVILDEFAFYQSPADLFGAVQPIISSNKDFRLVVSSTPASGGGSFFETLCNSKMYRVLTCSRTRAYYEFGVPVFSERDGKNITPEQAERDAVDKQAYRAAYELDFSAVRLRPVFNEDEVFNCAKSGRLVHLSDVTRPSDFVYVGIDVGGSGDRTVAWALSAGYKTQEVISFETGDIADQVNLFLRWCGSAKKIAIDATGVGAGFADMLSRRFRREVFPIHFSSRFRNRGTKMAMPFALTYFLKKNFEKISLPDNVLVFNDLLLPSYGEQQRIVTRRELGSHCDFYWALALANFGGMNTDRSILGRDMFAVSIP